MKNKYRVVIDTETTNTLDTPLVYDIAFLVVSNNGGEVVYKANYLVKEIWEDSGLMDNEFARHNIKYYKMLIKYEGLKVEPIIKIKKMFNDIYKRYNVTSILAYNHRFDVNALNYTIRYITGSKYRYFYPYGATIEDIWKGCKQTICNTKKYGKWCEDNNYLTKTGRPQTKAEVVYRYITKIPHFIEDHAALCDCFIENELYEKYMKYHKKRELSLY